MLSRFLLVTAALSLLALLAFQPAAPAKIKVYLVGDSTMSVKQVNTYPETGWGMPFAAFFDEEVLVDNRAQNGRSTKTFIAENRWQPVVNELHKGDYVFIQFGHNDEVPTKRSYTPEADYVANLKRFVSDTRSHQAQPVLLTPVARRKFDAAGKIEDTHTVYAELVRGVARDTNTPLIDLDRSSQALLQQLGPENSKFLFNYLTPGEHPNYPHGREDNTHFNELGARKMAQLVVADIQTLQLGLAGHLRRALVNKTVDPQGR